MFNEFNQINRKNKWKWYKNNLIRNKQVNIDQLYAVSSVRLYPMDSQYSTSMNQYYIFIIEKDSFMRIQITNQNRDLVIEIC